MDMLRGKVAIVTGGSSGIGRSTATTFAHEGATVVIAARGVERAERVVREIEMGGGEARFFRADVSIEADVEALVRQTIEWHGRLDCAFNNAATLGERLLPTADLEESELDRMLATNLKSVWFC